MNTIYRKSLVSVLVIAALSLSACSLTPSTPQVTEPETPEQVLGNAMLALSPSDVSLQVGQTSTLDIVLDSGSEQVSAVDVVLTYNPEDLEVTSVTPGTLFETYPLNSVENGMVKFSAASLQAFPSGEGTLATLEVKGLQVNPEATLTFEFVPGITTDSDVMEVSSATDILGSVQNAMLNITE